MELAGTEKALILGGIGMRRVLELFALASKPAVAQSLIVRGNLEPAFLVGARLHLPYAADHV